MEKEIKDLILQVIQAGAVDIRNVDVGEEAFLYASGNWGPGYVSIKNLVGRKALMKDLIRALARKVYTSHSEIDFVAGNVTGGLVPGWIVSEVLSILFHITVPFVYVRNARKKGGQKELVTGIANNPYITKGCNCLVVEELANFAQTTCNSAEHLRSIGYEVTAVCCIMFYDNPEAKKSLERLELDMVHLFTLPELLDVAEKHKTHPQAAIDGYREFLKDPLAWQTKKGLEPVERGGTK